jgi:hypothetical protein
MTWLDCYRRVIVGDTEFHAPPGERPRPICAVFRELHTGQLWRTLDWESRPPAELPFRWGPDTLFVGFYTAAEFGYFLALNRPLPVRIIDLYAEFRCLTSGLTVPCGHGLLGALAYHGLDGIAATEKDGLRQLAIRGGPYTEGDLQDLLDYCESDVQATTRLLLAMAERIDHPRALLRGRYQVAVASMERAGVPIDTETLTRLRNSWETIKYRLIEKVNRHYDVYVPTGRVLDPGTRYGAAILEEAEAWDLDPQALADAVDYVWAEERKSTEAVREARRAARRQTGLTVHRIEQWEDAGRDHSTYPGLDVQARELAGSYPDLAIGQGYVQDDPYDDTDHAGLLWERLREPDPMPRPRHDASLIREAAEQVANAGLVGVPYQGPYRFSAERWAQYLTRAGIAWPRLETGTLAMDDDTFREMAKLYPEQVGPIRELRYALFQLRLNELAVGSDGRNRCLLSPFGSKTSRNQPSNSKYIFGPAVWLRSLIQPGPGRAVAYCDWSQQELAIAASLSGDRRMQDAYTSGDFYLTFGKMAGAVPANATKATHATEREQFKVVSLGVLYGLSAEGLARKLGVPPCRGRELLHMHQETFATFWAWSQAVQDFAMLHGYLETVFGWRVHVGTNANPRSLRNFPMQANGAEMMRLACCLATERGIQVCAPVHDALLVEGPVGEIESVVLATQEAMREASELVLPGFPLRKESKIVRHPDRYTDPRGKGMWEAVQRLLAEESADPAPATECDR